MFLQVMPHPGDIRGHLKPVGETNPGDLAQSGIWLFRGRGIDPGADPPFLGASLQGRGRVFPALFLPTDPNQLIDRRHLSPDLNQILAQNSC